MDGQSAIERNRAALKRIVTSLVDMAGLDMGQSAIGSRKRLRAMALPKLLLPIADCRLPQLFPVTSIASYCGCCARPRRPRGG